MCDHGYDVTNMNRLTSTRPGWILIVGAILTLAFGLRTFGHSWDEGWYLHPDERFIAIVLTDRIHLPSLSEISSVFDPVHSPLNPRRDDPSGRPLSFAYGSLPLYVIGVVAWVAGQVTGTDLKTYEHAWSVGRYGTALLDTGTILLAILYAQRTFGRLTAALTGVLLATSVILIQLAHFFTSDSWITFFAMASLVAALRLRETQARRWAIIAGMTVGAGLATKVSVITLAVPVAVALIPWTRPSRAWFESERITRAAFAAAAAVITFAVFEPYALWHPGPFITDALTQWKIVNGHTDVPFTRQFVGTVRGVYQIDNLVRWGLGPVLGITVLIGFLAALPRVVRTRHTGEVLLLSWIIPYELVIGMAEAKFLRYLAPIVPALVILAAAWLVRLLDRQPARSLRRFAAWGLICVVLVTTFGWALAFESLYTRTNTRIAASEWIYRNIPPGSTLTAEYWDDALPLPLPGARPNLYETLSFDLYRDRDHEEAFSYIASVLQETDYIILSSNRLAASIPRLPWRYPVAIEYYRLLDAGQLGFQLVHHGLDYPRLGPLSFPDLSADESFRVYDHPEVRIYKKVEELSIAELRERFAPALAQPWSPTREPPSGDLMLRTPLDAQSRSWDLDLGWSASLTSSGAGAVVVWLVVLSLLQVATLPLTLTIFRSFPDLGWGFGRLLGLLLTGYVVWIFASLQVAEFTVGWIVGLSVALGGGIWVVWRSHLPGLVTEVRARWRLIVATELVFLGVFGLFLCLRALNPDLWQTYFGGEKPMEMAYTSAIARSPSFPPYDPWFAGGIMNYYYYGFYLFALLWKVTGIPPEIAFQLSVATLAGLLGTGVFSLSSAMVTRLLSLQRARWAVATGLLGVFLFVLIGNLDAARQMLTGRSLTVDFWQSSRVVDFAITEFPYFTMSWADLHPHAIALPLTVLLIALAYQWLCRAHDVPEERAPWWLWSGVATVVGGSIAVTNAWDLPFTVLMLGAGLVAAAVSTGNQPVRSVGLGLAHWAAIVVAGRVLFAPFFDRFVALVSGVERTRFGTPLAQYSVHYGIYLAILIAAGLAVALARIRLNRRVAVSAGLGACAGLLGLLLGALISGSVALFPALVIALIGGTAVSAILPHLLRTETDWTAIVPGLWVALLIGITAPYRPTAALLLGIVVVATAFWIRVRHQPGPSLVAISVVGAAGITLGADLLYVVDDLSGSDWERMNTVFKFYLEGWTLYALAATVALAWLIHHVVSASPPPLGFVAGPLARKRRRAESDTSGPTAPGVARAGLLISVVLITAGLAYPLFATGARLAERMPGSPAHLSLDGLEWMRSSWITNARGERIDFSGDYAAIQWLRENAQSTPILLEASIGPYRGNGSRFSAATGFPDVLGWDRHERQQREAPEIDQRLHDVRRIYTSTDVDEKRALLRRYRVRYVVVGDVERLWTIEPYFAGATSKHEHYATAEGLASFDRMLGTDLQLVFESGPTRIYEVLPFSTIPPASTAGVNR